MSARTESLFPATNPACLPGGLEAKPPPPTATDLRREGVSDADSIRIRGERYAKDHFGASWEEVATRRHPQLPKWHAMDKVYQEYRRKWTRRGPDESDKRQQRRARAGNLPLRCNCGTVPPWEWHAAGLADAARGTEPPRRWAPQSSRASPASLATFAHCRLVACALLVRRQKATRAPVLCLHGAA